MDDFLEFFNVDAESSKDKIVKWSMLDLPITEDLNVDNEEEKATRHRVFPTLKDMNGGETISIGTKKFSVVCQKTYNIDFGSNDYGIILRDEEGINHHIAYDFLSIVISPEKFRYRKRVSYKEVSF